MPTPIVSVYRFSLKPGVSDIDFLNISNKVQTFLSQQQNFQYRSIAKTDDNRWIDINYWADNTMSEKIDKAFSENIDCKAFIELIDLESMYVDKATVLSASACEEAA